MSVKKIRYSEIFRSFQGEGSKMGVPCIWIRLWGCNLNCSGFGQTDPSDPKTYDLPYESFDAKSVSDVMQLPVWTKGCDSSYSWAKKFSHLAELSTAQEICDDFEDLLESDINPEKRFVFTPWKEKNVDEPPSAILRRPGVQELRKYDLCFTGGEPMMQQKSIVSILEELIERQNLPNCVQIETNGTQMIKCEEFFNLFETLDNVPLFWSCSPKLSASGEKWSKTIKPDVLAQYSSIESTGQLKYVVDNTDKCWDEVERATEIYRNAGIDWPVWIMPVGSDEGSLSKNTAMICDTAVARGYNVSPRVHVYVYKNAIGK